MKNIDNKKAKKKNAKVPSEDIWVMLLSTIRYSFGRRSYMPSLCGDLIEKYKACLSQFQLEQIEREIRGAITQARAFDEDGFLGDKYTDETWLEIADKLRKELGI